MTVKTVAELRQKFETGDTPTAQDFIDFLDSFLHAGLANFPNPLPAVSGAALTNIGSALPDPLPAVSGENLTNINPSEYNVPGSMPIPSYATDTTFVLTGDWTASADDPNKVFLIGRRLRLRIADAYFYTSVDDAEFSGGTTTVSTLAAMPGSPIQECAVSVITPAASGGGVSAETLGIADKVAFLGVVWPGIFDASDLSDGWLLMDDGTIGETGSGATTRANDDVFPLYERIWNRVSDTWAPVSTGRGASAAADFAAGKTLTLTRALGRVLACAGTGSGLSARALGEYLGAETETPTVAKTAQHNHPGSTVTVHGDTGDTAVPEAGIAAGFNGNAPLNIANQGSGTALNIANPTAYMNFAIRYK